MKCCSYLDPPPGFSDLSQQDHRVRNRSIICAHAFRRFGFHPHRTQRDAQQCRNSSAYRASVGTDLRSREDESGIHVNHSIAGGFHAPERFLEKYSRVRAFPVRVRGRKKRANIRRGDCAEQRVCNGMQKNVSVRVAAQTFGVCQRDSANLEGDATFELVGVPAVADASSR